VVSRFLLVSLIMDAVLENATIHQRRQTLCRMTNGIGSDDAYSATLSRIQEQKGNKLKLGMEAVRWVSHSERPLKAQELCHGIIYRPQCPQCRIDEALVELHFRTYYSR